MQFHYWAWPDHGVPALVRPLLDMVRLIRDCQASETVININVTLIIIIIINH